MASVHMVVQEKNGWPREINDSDTVTDLDNNASLKARLQKARLVQKVPAAKTTDLISGAGGRAGNSATNGFTIAAQPDMGRNLRVVFALNWDGGDVVVNGLDPLGNAVSETFIGASNVTRVGTKVFASVTSASKTLVGANAAIATIGTGDMIGFSAELFDNAGLLFCDGVYEAVTMSTTYHAFTPTTAPNAVRVFSVFANFK